MKALFLNKPGDLSYGEKPMPVCAPGEVMIRVDAVCICGSDYHAIRGNQGMYALPRVIGHEVGGTVYQVGEEVTAFQPGDKVCLMPCISCGTCRACQKGKTNACNHLQLYGVQIDGGLQEYLCAPEKHFLKVPGNASPAAISMIEPLTIGAHGVAKLNLEAGDQVLVIGAGPIGVTCAVNAASYGAKVTMADTSASRREFVAKQFGFDVLDPLEENYRQSILNITQGMLFDAVVDTTAFKGSMENTWKWIANGGKLVFVGICTGTLEFDGRGFHSKEPSLYVTRNSTDEDYRRVVSLWEKGMIDPEKFVTHTATFDNAAEAILKWVDPASGVFKGVITFP